MNRLETKTYRVIAHLADGDVEIKPKGKDKFLTLNEAEEARNEHLNMCDDIDIVEEIKLKIKIMKTKDYFIERAEKRLDKKRKNLKANNAIGETIANEIFIKDFEPTNEFIPYSTLTEYIRSYLYDNGIKKTEEEIFQIRNQLTTHLCELINTNTIYKAYIELGEGETHLKVIKKIGFY